ncbi:MAG: endonuclease/exonuclease/phosphatase family protein [Actinomycetota bacterium]|nr:endonuclease/exonuclease/phosphatase family protein [Actinomycetota bacterium]
MKILCCNVNGRVRGALERQKRSLLKRKPDVLALQEVWMGSYADWCRGLAQAGYSVVSAVDLVALPYPAPPVPGEPYPSPPFPPRRRDHIQRKYFNLVAARRPIAMLPGLSFGNPDEALYAFPEKYVAARVTIAGAEVDVHNAHLPPGVSRGAIKAHTFEAITRRVDRDSDNPRILCGDFNAPSDEDAKGPVHKLKRNWDEQTKTRWLEAERALFGNPHMRDTYRTVHEGQESLPASHFTGGTGHRYDYIFASSELQAESCEYLTDWLDSDRPDGRLSDHAPVEADLSLV